MTGIMAAQFGAKPAKWELNREALEKFLRWLDDDPDVAAREHEIIRCRLVKYFIRKGYPGDPDDVFYKTIDRVMQKLEEDEKFNYAPPLTLCYGIGRNVLKEEWRKLRRLQIDPLPDDDIFPDLHLSNSGREQEALCLDSCMEKLSPAERELIITFYMGPEARKALAGQIGGQGRLRLKAFRIREKLRVCITECLQECLKRNAQ